MIGSGQTTGYPPAGGGGEAGQTSLFTVGHRGDRADLFRTLRPLKRFCSAPRDEELDERRTAEASADAGALVLSFRRREERWLELAVLIDVSASMALWREAAEEVLHVLTRLGAFRDVLAWSFDSDEPEPRFRPFRRRADSGRADQHSGIAYQVSGAARILGDLGRCWPGLAAADYGGYPRPTGERRLVSLVNPLPHRMWHRSGIRTLPMYQRVTGTKDKLAVRHSWAPGRPRMCANGCRYGASMRTSLASGRASSPESATGKRLVSPWNSGLTTRLNRRLPYRPQTG